MAPEKEELPLLVQALIHSYEDHIETLKAKILELENIITRRGSIPSSPIPTKKPVLRTTSEIISALEAQSRNFKHEVRDETK